MSSRTRALIAASIASLWMAACSTEVPLPPTQDDIAASEQHKQAFVDALKPHRAGKPMIAVLASNDGTEMTDLLLPHAVLVRAGVADVQVIAPRSGRVELYPALQIDGAQDFAAFDRAHPSGADYVIVPAMGDGNVPEVIAWLREQVDKGDASWQSAAAHSLSAEPACWTDVVSPAIGTTAKPCSNTRVPATFRTSAT